MSTLLKGVRFSERTVATGIGIWDEMAADLKKEWEEAVAEIEGHIAAAPWGQGAEGVRFHEALMRGGGPMRMIRAGRQIIEQIEAMGPTMRVTISNSVAADQAEAERIKKLLEA
ncbi:hypothetical protein [Nonomuraea lactucae]|uniref:hypothetical protein n=1 Tax=Nonomuraea lactucae TaxID=2249762 RepID=UPI000DE2F1F4|nr:hypothetical protein [Nonomuraea lactucae]